MVKGRIFYLKSTINSLQENKRISNVPLYLFIFSFIYFFELQWEQKEINNIISKRLFLTVSSQNPLPFCSDH